MISVSMIYLQKMLEMTFARSLSSMSQKPGALSIKQFETWRPILSQHLCGPFSFSIQNTVGKILVSTWPEMAKHVQMKLTTAGQMRLGYAICYTTKIEIKRD